MRCCRVQERTEIDFGKFCVFGVKLVGMQGLGEHLR